MKVSGSAIELSTWLSAAKWMTPVTSISSKIFATRASSVMSPMTGTTLGSFACSENAPVSAA